MLSSTNRVDSELVKPRAVSRARIIGLFLISGAALLFEILLSRIFSVTLYYNLAFIAISVAMLGSAVGATLVYSTASIRRSVQTSDLMAALSVVAAVSMVVSIAIYARMPTAIRLSDDIFGIVGGCLVMAVPFIFFGALTTLAFSEGTEISKVYAADLCGAGVGCLAVIGLLRMLSAPAAIVVAAVIAAAAAPIFATRSRTRSLSIVALMSIAVIGIIVARTPILRLRTAKGFPETTPLVERWNSFSRVQVLGSPDVAQQPFGWGFSPRYVPAKTAHELAVSIDAASGTVLTQYSGDTASIDYLRYDISNTAHYLRHDARVAVVGSGGGRDVLAALAFHQKSVVGIEVNESILGFLNRDFAAFTGHLDRQPGVQFVNDEARSYLTHHQGEFDIIQISLTDTWAATAAGAFALTENSLYTTEAWQTFLKKLGRGGVLTVTRWYRYPRPGEMIRLSNLAGAALRSQGVTDPRGHLVMLMTPSSNDQIPTGVATLLVFRDAIDANQLSAIERVAAYMQWKLILTPRVSAEPLIARAVSAVGSDPVLDAQAFEWRAPSDDRPFFFYTARLSALIHPRLYSDESVRRALLLLVVFLGTVAFLSVVGVFLPLIVSAGTRRPAGAMPFFVFFAAIGSGFMFIEISQLQRLTVVLGKPVYALSVILFTLLLTSGLGARISVSIKRGVVLLAIAGMTLLVGLIEPLVIAAANNMDTAMRIIAAVALIAPAGLAMGFAFPAGMRLAAPMYSPLRPWLCAINAATSVSTSVLAIIVSLHGSITMTYWLGVLSYVVAAGVYRVASRRFADTTDNASREAPQALLEIRTA